MYKTWIGIVRGASTDGMKGKAVRIQRTKSIIFIRRDITAVPYYYFIGLMSRTVLIYRAQFMVPAIESIYWPEMATGTVMWNVRRGLYVDVDLYASSAASGERGMDPHNARRPEQIIVADRERAASYATGTDTRLSICGPDCDNHRRRNSFAMRDEFSRSSENGLAARRDATVRSPSDLRANKTRRRIVFTTRERKSDYLVCLIEEY